MKRMLIAGHARFAEGLLSALSLIMGEQKDITCINAFVTEIPLEKQIDDFTASLSEGDQALIVTDAFFGSVNQKLMEKKMASEMLKNSLMVTGVNLPLILELATFLDGPELITKEQLDQTVRQAGEQLKVVNLFYDGDDADDFAF